ncbi:DUF4260 family protein [Deinococcus sp.]|uniref:DUF4260 family protein n=1 Tax=Deinococcus sp. TaxID=47478 RepID=UPI003C7B539A
MKKNTVSLYLEPVLWLRLEGLLVLAASVVAYRALNGPWWGLLLGFLADLSFVAYLAGPRAGGNGYNLIHALVLPLALGLLGWELHLPLALLIALIWTAHIGLDRLFGYGLKYPDAFGRTHLESAPAPRQALPTTR